MHIRHGLRSHVLFQDRIDPWSISIARFHAAGLADLSEAPELPSDPALARALVLLQRLLRGRATQVEMQHGKNARLALVRELRLGPAGVADRVV